VPRHEDLSGSGCIAPLFLTSALDGGEWSGAPAAIPPRKQPSVSTGKEAGWGPSTGLDAIDKNLVTAGKQTPAAEPAAHRYTDRVLPSLSALHFIQGKMLTLLILFHDHLIFHHTFIFMNTIPELGKYVHFVLLQLHTHTHMARV
jgi:hypothetical protein